MNWRKFGDPTQCIALYVQTTLRFGVSAAEAEAACSRPDGDAVNARVAGEGEKKIEQTYK